MEDKNEKQLLDYKKDFIYNALEDGWSISKKEECYIFRKKHEQKKEDYLDSYLSKFIEKNLKHK